MNIANRLTLFRMGCIPVFVLLLTLNIDLGEITLWNQTLPCIDFIAGLLFAIASFTDYLDGYLARKYHLITQFGIFFDPMADKLLVIAALVLLVARGDLSAWICIIIVSRELLVTGLRVLLAQQNGRVLAAAWPGKVKTFTQMFAILFYLWHELGFHFLPFSMAKLLIYLCLIFTIYSGIDYFWKGRSVFSNTIQ